MSRQFYNSRVKFAAESEVLVRESVRNASLLFLLAEESGKTETPKKEDDDDTEESSDELDSFFDSQGVKAIKELDLMLKKLSVKSKSSGAPLFPEVTKLLQAGKSRIAASITNADDNEKSAAAISSVKLFLASVSFLLASAAKRVKTAGKEKDDQSVAKTFGDGEESKGKSEVTKLVASKFAPAPAAWQAIRKIKSAVGIEESKTAQLVISADFNEDLFLESQMNDAELLNEGLLSWFLGLFKSESPPSGKASVKALTALLKGPIDTALVNDLSNASSKEIHDLVMNNMAFFKSFVTDPPKITPPASSGEGSGGEGAGDKKGDAGSAASSGGSEPTPADVKNVTSIAGGDRSEISSSLEDEYGKKIAQAFTDIAVGKKKLEDFDGTSKDVLSVIIKNLSSQVDKGGKPDATKASAAVSKKVLNLKPEDEDFVKNLVGSSGLRSLKKALVNNEKARKSLKLETMRRDTLSLIEGALTMKSLSFLFEATMPAEVKKAIVPAIEPHVKSGESATAVAQKIYDRFTGKKAKESSESGSEKNPHQKQYKGKFVKLDDKVYKMGATSGWYPWRKGIESQGKKLAANVNITTVRKLNRLAKDNKNLMSKPPEAKSETKPTEKTDTASGSKTGSSPKSTTPKNKVSEGLNLCRVFFLDNEGPSVLKEMAYESSDSHKTDSDNVVMERWQRLAGII